MRWTDACCLVAAVGLAGGCSFAITGSRCTATCDKIWSPAECDVQVPGVSQDMMYEDCVDSCRDASRQGGDLMGYDPWEQHVSGEPIELVNRTQVKEWAECVETVPCEDLLMGYCQPLF